MIASELTIIAFAGAFGLIFGSFLNVVIHRGPALWGLVEENSGRHGGLAHPRSYCPACGATLRAGNLVPIVSYLAQRGRCARCGAAIPARYPLVETAGAGALIAAYLIHGVSADAAILSVFFLALIALAGIDAETGYLPDAITLPLIAGGVVANIGDRFAPLGASVIGAAAGYLSFWLVGEAFHRLRGREGLGMGDAKLLAGIGAWGGWTVLAPCVFVAAFLALLGVGAAMLSGRKVSRETEIPFGPALAVAGALAVGAVSAGLDLALAFAPAPVVR